MFSYIDLAIIVILCLFFVIVICIQAVLDVFTQRYTIYGQLIDSISEIVFKNDPVHYDSEDSLLIDE